MKTDLLLPCILLIIIQVRSTNAGANVKAADNFFVQKYADISAPRGLFLDSAGDILVLSKFSSAITTLSEIPNKDGTVYVAKHLILPGSNLNLTHGVAFYNGFVYASSASEVYRWPYVAGTRTLISAPAEVVIKNLPSGGYSTRTLVFHPVTPHTLYVSIGSLENVDPNADRAKILEFNVANIPDGGFDGSSSSVTVFASGLRNTVGLGFDSLNVLWGVDNSVENLYRADLGADIHNTNPAEELNKLTSKNFYGYPYCFSSFDILNTKPRNTQFAWPTFQVDGVHTDEWCEAVTNNAKPVLAMPAHTAPLGIEFYKYCLSESEGGFNCSFQGNAFIAHHGSVNSNKRVGYRVTRVEFNKSGMPTGTIGDVVFAGDIDTCDPSSTCFRPVNAIFDRNGYLIVSADTTGEIFRVSYGTAPPPISGSAMGLTVSTFATALIILLGISMNI